MVHKNIKTGRLQEELEQQNLPTFTPPSSILIIVFFNTTPATSHLVLCL